MGRLAPQHGTWHTACGRSHLLLAAGLLASAIALSPGAWANSGITSVTESSAITTESTSRIRRCDACHDIETEISHPVGVIPSMQVPAQLPLERGRITCFTCHLEASAAQHEQARANHDPLLRLSGDASQLCAACHNGYVSGATSPHANTPTQAHPKPNARKDDRAAPETFLSVDEESRTCMTCHDGSIASDVVHLRLTPTGPDASQDHPVGVAMRGSSIRRLGFGELANPDALDHRIRLFDGTVGCGSCHNLYSRLENHLVITNIKSKLCLSCHLF